MKENGMTSKLMTALALAAALVAAPAIAQQAGAQGQSVTATGTVKKVDAAKRVVNLSHGPIAAIDWPAMTMEFAVAPDVNLSAVKPGQEVEFTLAPKAGAKGEYTVTGVKPKS
jgi:Cu(I)/Ag(I) efflux system periplasmic protein CusF